MNALGDQYSGAEREIYAIHARHVAPFEHTLPDPGSLLVREGGVGAPFPVYSAFADLAFSSAALANLALLGFRSLASRNALPIPLALSAFTAFLILALLAFSLSGRASYFAALTLPSEVALLPLALARGALILANLALLALSAFLASLASRAWLTLLA
jgi:hypothetical protein